MSKELTGYGAGNATQSLVEDGVRLASEYFLNNGVEAEDCFNAFVHGDETESLHIHWKQAEEVANSVLLGNTHTDSIVYLEFINDEDNEV